MENIPKNDREKNDKLIHTTQNYNNLKSKNILVKQQKIENKGLIQMKKQQKLYINSKRHKNLKTKENKQLRENRKQNPLKMNKRMMKTKTVLNGNIWK